MDDDCFGVGAGFPAIESCPNPECDSIDFSVIMLYREGESATLDGSGGVFEMHHDYIMDSAVSFMECRECETTIIEDGDVVAETLK